MSSEGNIVSERNVFARDGLCSMFGALTAVGAYIMIPLPPSPSPCRRFLSICRALLGGYLGALSQVVLYSACVIGLPVFAGARPGQGPPRPTGGYLIGFVVGAFVIGKLTCHPEEARADLLICAMSMGIAVVYILGITQLMIVAKLDFEKAIAHRTAPAPAGDILKGSSLPPSSAGKCRDHIRL